MKMACLLGGPIGQGWLLPQSAACPMTVPVNTHGPQAFVKKLSLLLLSLFGFSAVRAGDVAIAIENLPAAPSRVFVAVYPDAEAMSKNKPSLTQISEARGDPTTVVFKDMAPGTYAFVAFADENSNGKLDTNFVGMPTERYGFSNNVMGLFGPPDFSAASVQLTDDKRSVSIRLR